MRFAYVVPYTTELEFVELARLGEEHGWDAVFSWEAVFRHDAWATLAAAAVSTERIRLGTLITPVPRYRPWDLAARVGSVDRLSGGRVVLGAGLGAPNANWLAFEPDDGRAVRAQRLDEGLDILTGLLGGQPFSYDGRHFSARPVTELAPPPPVQRPHPPIWLVGALVRGRQRQPSLARAARYDGIFPAVARAAEGQSGITLETFGEIVQRVRDFRAEAGLGDRPYDFVIEGDSYHGFVEVEGGPADWEAAGATWWVESWWDLPETSETVDELRRRITAGPPRN
ncbi:LLM class flavin-dependent oxidoreductase [Flexivirga oryzae]|uniref:Alkanesulfonate monooxygenase SsuD/methylene tetrahydromethanopterin reductase-like flavin-dependent oxidoreductase (Luciferase family) n=1 Tax=Flexivirga oryzae TaxID=1794944 RepID=A0A839MXS7_9MICO|nr:LLM class flavin-dependent oxidoreductase [Flexivirga oryzae]MBB2890250.1 alkanesulfonate monooxygenase SsuD/methylene tetrahydromethanopterin reductase-like flavin-dependent oxidoreductase (luciferase family) [Flexivirga oryzae]